MVLKSPLFLYKTVVHNVNQMTQHSNESDIYLTYYNEGDQRSLIIESDGHSIWAYILNSEKQLEFDGFLCSLGTVVNSSDDVKEFLSKGYQPPLQEQFMNDFSVQQNLKASDITITWVDNIVQILIHDILFLQLEIKYKRSLSKAIAMEGAYGLPLNNK